MTEYNLFCYSEKCNDENSFQQKRYRIFNKEVSNERYEEVKKLVISILPQNKLQLSEYWKTVTLAQWKQLLEIPEAKGFEKGFSFISGITINPVNDLLGKEVSVTLDGQTYTAKIISKS